MTTENNIGISQGTASKSKNIFNFTAGGMSATFHTIGVLYGVYLHDQTIVSNKCNDSKACTCNRVLTRCNGMIRDDVSFFATSGGVFPVLILHIMYANKIPLNATSWKYIIFNAMSRLTPQTMFKFYMYHLLNSLANTLLYKTGIGERKSLIYKECIDIITNIIIEPIEEYYRIVGNDAKLTKRKLTKPSFSADSQFIYNYHQMSNDYKSSGLSENYTFLNDDEYYTFPDTIFEVTRSCVAISVNWNDICDSEGLLKKPHECTVCFDSGIISSNWNNQLEKYMVGENLKNIFVNTIRPINMPNDGAISQIYNNFIYGMYKYTFDPTMWSKFNENDFIKSLKDDSSGNKSTTSLIYSSLFNPTYDKNYIKTNDMYDYVYNSLFQTPNHLVQFTAHKHSNMRYQMTLIAYAANLNYMLLDCAAPDSPDSPDVLIHNSFLRNETMSSKIDEEIKSTDSVDNTVAKLRHLLSDHCKSELTREIQNINSNMDFMGNIFEIVGTVASWF